MKKKKPLKKVPTWLESIKSVRGDLIPSPKPILSEADKRKSCRTRRKQALRRELDD